MHNLVGTVWYIHIHHKQLRPSGRPKQFLDQNTKTENVTSEKPSFGRNQLIDQTILVLAKTVSFGRNNLFWPKCYSRGDATRDAADGEQDTEISKVCSQNASLLAERVVFGRNRCYLAETVCFGRYGGRGIWGRNCFGQIIDHRNQIIGHRNVIRSTTTITYRDFTPDMGVSYMLFHRSFHIFVITSLRQGIEYFNFQCKLWYR